MCSLKWLRASPGLAPLPGRIRTSLIPGAARCALAPGFNPAAPPARKAKAVACNYAAAASCRDPRRKQACTPNSPLGPERVESRILQMKPDPDRLSGERFQIGSSGPGHLGSQLIAADRLRPDVRETGWKLAPGNFG